MKKPLWFLSLALLLLMLPLYGCNQERSEGESLNIAQNYIISAPTFKFDGVDGSVQFVSSRPLGQNGWEFTFNFTSAHAGYGDRKGKVLAQVVTTHKATIQVVNGKVSLAILDNNWDELNQKTL